MVFTAREYPGGFKHLMFKWDRIIWRKPADLHLRNYRTLPLKTDAFIDHSGEHAKCEVCGYVLIRMSLPDGWFVETCSAMPAIPPVGSQLFEKWLQSLSPEKLPTSRV